ncbi:MAG: FlgO family outer membrane protein [Planctomycetota bacterium]
MQRLLLITFITLTVSLLDFNTTVAYEKEIKGISSTITESIAKSGKKTIAVVDFSDLQGNVTELGRFIAEELSVDLTMSAKNFEVIDRNHLKSILTEHKLSMSGLVDPNTVKKLGQIAGVDAIITGSVTPFGDSIRISCKVIATDTARVIGAAKGDIAKTKAIEELLSRGIDMGQVSSSTPSYAPSTSGVQSKRVGDITITVKRITVANGQVTVMLDFLNHTDKDLTLHIGYGTDKEILTDEKGNILKNYFSDSRTTLNRRSNNDIVRYFKYRGGIKDIGSIFALSFTFRLWDDVAQRWASSGYDISFSDIKAQMPK